MNLHTGIAVAVALAVMGIIFMFPNFLPAGLPTINTSTSESSSNTTSSMQSNAELQITDTVVGTGLVAEWGDTVTVNYIGSLTNGQVFDASANHGNTGFTFVLGVGQVIKGWDQGVDGMRVGGKRTLVIPPNLAYGDQAIGNIIPANSTLVFEVELLAVKKPTR